MSEVDHTDQTNRIASSFVSNSENNNEQNHKFNLQEIQKDEAQIRRIASSGAFPQQSKPEGRVLVLYTGGTIGMIRNKHGGN
jgi:L-asparaginase/Glu-tRNA(Gln) amidotransferase subunit D